MNKLPMTKLEMQRDRNRRRWDRPFKNFSPRPKPRAEWNPAGGFMMTPYTVPGEMITNPERVADQVRNLSAEGREELLSGWALRCRDNQVYQRWLKAYPEFVA